MPLQQPFFFVESRTLLFPKHWPGCGPTTNGNNPGNNMGVLVQPQIFDSTSDQDEAVELPSGPDIFIDQHCS